MSKRALALGAGLVVVLGVAAGYWLVQSSRGPEATGQGQAEKWYHCPRCGLELPCPPGFEERVVFCSHCGSAKSVMEVRARAWAPGGFLAGRGSKLVPAIVIGVAALLAVVLLLASLVRKGAKASQRESADAASVCRCPGCGRRLHYRRSQAGRRAACPACDAPVVFPPYDDDPVRAWQKSLVTWAQRTARRNQDG
jgi:DNA-directed RNA polymerase subunit RPC12/RpoP